MSASTATFEPSQLVSVNIAVNKTGAVKLVIAVEPEAYDAKDSVKTKYKIIKNNFPNAEEQWSIFASSILEAEKQFYLQDKNYEMLRLNSKVTQKAMLTRNAKYLQWNSLIKQGLESIGDDDEEATNLFAKKGNSKEVRLGLKLAIMIRLALEPRREFITKQQKNFALYNIAEPEVKKEVVKPRAQTLAAPLSQSLWSLWHWSPWKKSNPLVQEMKTIKSVKI